MKPFDLERALVGDKVLTRDGREATQLHSFDCGGDCLAGVIDGQLETWDKNGKYWAANQDSDSDLFMAPKTVKRWVNFYPSPYDALDYVTKEQAIAHARSRAIAIAVPVEFEEGYGVKS